MPKSAHPTLSLKGVMAFRKKNQFFQENIFLGISSWNFSIFQNSLRVECIFKKSKKIFKNTMPKRAHSDSNLKKVMIFRKKSIFLGKIVLCILCWNFSMFQSNLRVQCIFYKSRKASKLQCRRVLTQIQIWRKLWFFEKFKVFKKNFFFEIFDWN